MGFMDVLGFLFYGGASIVNSADKHLRTDHDIQMSKDKGRKSYYDYTGKRIVERTFDTNEIVQLKISHGHRQKVGIKTGYVYQDYTQEKIDKENENLKREGKKFHYESTKSMGKWFVNGSAVKIKVENSTGKPFETSRFRHNDGKVVFIRYYLDLNASDPMADFSTAKKMDYEEAKLYMVNEFDNNSYELLY